MSPIIYMGFLLVFLPGSVTGNKEITDCDCISRQEFEDRLFSEIQLRKKLEADIENIKASLGQTGTGSDTYRTHFKNPSESGVPYPEASQTVTNHSSEINVKRQNRNIMEDVVFGRQAFTVELITTLSHMSLGQIVRFDNVISQLGHGFALRTGVFTAKNAGWYVFTLTLMVDIDDEMELHIMRDGDIIARCWDIGDDSDSVTQTVVTHLEGGSTVWVFITPEDYKATGKPPSTTLDPDVERFRRCHQNDIENVFPFVLVGLLYVLTGPELAIAVLVFRLFAGSRLLHTIVYLNIIPQPSRTMCFFMGVGVNIYMAIAVIKSGAC